MANCEDSDREADGSMVSDRPKKLWGLIVRCGGGGRLNRKKEAVLVAEKAATAGSERKLRELLKRPEYDDDAEKEDEVRRNKEQALQELKQVASKLQQEGSMELVLEGCMEVRRLAKDDPQARTTLALLGVIPPLVALLDDGQDRPATFQFQIAALYALLNLAVANDANKAAIVKSGAVHKMLNLVQSLNGGATTNHAAVAEAVVANFLGLSALDSNKLIIGSSSGAIPFLVKTLKDQDGVFSNQAKHDALRALYNLSIAPQNVFAMLEETDLISHFFSKLGDTDTMMSERILSILSNMVSIPEGRKRISSEPDSFAILIDIFHWMDSPGCQEKASYIMMVMAHKSYEDRRAMVDAGIVSSLLELTLIGSPLAQTRASKLLEFLNLDKGKQLVPGEGVSNAMSLSAPLYDGPILSALEAEDDDDDMMSPEAKAVKQLAQMSLQNNMKRMVKRANLPHDEYVPSDSFKSLTSSSTSKSLPL